MKEIVEQILREEFNSIETDLISEHLRLGMKSSGKWVNSLSVEVKETGTALFEAYIVAPGYTQQLIHGRKPGKFPPIKEIENWIKKSNKFNAVLNHIKLKSLAFLIARKIKEKGTKYYQQGGTKLLDAVITPERVLRIINRVGGELLHTFADQVKTEYKNIA